MCFRLCILVLRFFFFQWEIYCFFALVVFIQIFKTWVPARLCDCVCERVVCLLSVFLYILALRFFFLHIHAHVHAHVHVHVHVHVRLSVFRTPRPGDLFDGKRGRQGMPRGERGGRTSLSVSRSLADLGEHTRRHTAPLDRLRRAPLSST